MILIRFLISKQTWFIAPLLVLLSFGYFRVIKPIKDAQSQAITAVKAATQSLQISRDSVRAFRLVNSEMVVDNQFKDSLIGKLQVSIRGISKVLQKREVENAELEAKVGELAGGVVVVRDTVFVYTKRDFWGRETVVVGKGGG